MHILHINMHRQWGGQPNRVLTTAKGLRDLGHDVVVSGPRDCELVKRARQDGFETFDDLELRTGMRPASIRRDVRAMKSHLHKQQYDIIDTHGSQDTWRVHAALLGWDKNERPIFVRSRHNIFPVTGNIMNRWLYSNIDHVITVSPQVIPHLSKVMPPERCTSIYSAPDIARHKSLDSQAKAFRQAIRQELGLQPDAFVIGVVGRLAPEKGHRHLIEAATQIVNAIPSAQFVFAGQGRSRTDLEDQIAQLGPYMASRFHLLGFRKDVPQILRSFDIFVLPSTEGESLGTSILEAFLADLPVVGTNLGGVGESVIDGQTGRLVEPANSSALAAAIIDLASNPEHAKAMALAGKQRVETLFSPEGIARETEALYQKLIDQRNNQCAKIK